MSPLAFTAALQRLKGSPNGTDNPRWAHHDASAFSDCKDKAERPELCLMCGKGASRKNRCPSCKIARYCSAECRESDTQLHGRICASLRSLATETRPSESHHHAVLFPCDSKSPEIIWLQVHLDHETGHICFKFDRADVAEFQAEFGEPRIWHFNLNKLETHLQKDLAHGLDIIMFNEKETMGPKWLNHCLLGLGKPGFVSCNFGPILLWAYDVHEYGAFKAPRDVDIRDIRHAVDCFVLNSANPAISDPARYLPANTMIPALKINDLDDKWMQALGVTQQMEMAIVPRDHQCFEAYAIGRMFHLGLRWYIRTAVPIGSSPIGETHLHHEELLDIFRETMILEVYGTSRKVNDSFQFRIVQLRHSASFHILQVNGKAIYTAHVQAVLEYFRLVKNTKSMYSEKGFRAFWEYFKGKEAKRGHPLQGIPSPYELELGGPPFDPLSLGVVQWIQSHNTYEEFIDKQGAAIMDSHASGGLNERKKEGKPEFSAEEVNEILETKTKRLAERHAEDREAE